MHKKNEKYTLTVIIVSYNTANLLKNCLNSLTQLDNKITFEVVVVDNASTDESIKTVESISKKLSIKIIKNNTNKGFGAANNQGFKIAKGEFILLLNSDTIVNSTAIIQSIEYMRKDKSIGVLGCKLVQSDKIVQSNGGYFPSLINVFFWMTFLDDIKIFYDLIKPYHINPNFEQDEMSDQDWVTGAYFMIRKKVYEEVGGFDEDYFMYVEEMDYCYRIKRKGWKVIYYPKSEIIHLGGASGTSENSIINEFKGLKIFYNKHKNNKIILRLLLRIGILLRILLFSVLNKQRRSKIYEKAWKTI